jgi:hypothetical protein
MTDATFEKVQHSDNRLYGPQKLLVCGFPAATQPKFNAVRQMAGLMGVPVVWAHLEDMDRPIAALLDLPDGTGAGIDSTLPRAIVVCGITENQLHALMGSCRQAKMKQVLWAVLTPTSENWPLIQLLHELQAERDALAKANKR